MRLWIVPAVALGLAAAACNSSEPASNNNGSGNTAAATAEIAKVSLDQPIVVLGNENPTSVDITSDKLVLNNLGTEVGSAPNTGPTVTGNVAVWNATLADNKPLVVTLTGTDCSDTMSDRIYPLTAKIEVGGESIVGCAASKAALERVGESGRVE